MIKKIIISFLVLVFFNTHLVMANSLPLMPYPQSVKLQQGEYLLPKKISISIAGMNEQRKKFIVQRMAKHLNQYAFSLEEKKAQAVKTLPAVIKVKINQTATELLAYPKLKSDESYQLTIDVNGISIQAKTEFGAMHGLSTLMQLTDAKLADKNTQLPYLTIKDSPRFPWRGLMIDSVRHFISIESIKRQIDGMAAAKLNVFHWHLTDDQGWRIESKTYPKLQELASDGQFYTQQEIKDVVRYASLLGIRVVPEFDVPGHASAIAVAYPELVTIQKPYSMEDKWGVFEPLLDPSNDKTYQFIDDIVGELTQLFPDTYLHIGGDEVHPVHWQESEPVQQFMKDHGLKNEHDLQALFNQKVQKILAKHERKMMGWDEIYHPDLPKDIMVQSWRGMESLNQIASNGYQGLLSTGYYIDQPQSTSYHYRNDPLAKRAAALTKLLPNDKVSAWQFTMPRLKGSDVKGTLVLVKRNEYVINAYAKFNNNRYQKVFTDQRLATNLQQINFVLDTWMGPTRGEFDLSNPAAIKGRMLIGNTHYSVTGEKLKNFNFSGIKLLPNLAKNDENNILGGEATLWTEMVTEENLDLRTWPRLFAIAERFWSVKSKTNIDDMYRRLFQISQYAENIGLKHQIQHVAGIQSLVFPKTDISSLLVLAEQLEPANYYTRHHLKFKNGFYHQRAPLKQFVDFLPVESFALVKMNQQLTAYKKGDIQGLQAIIDTMRNWHEGYAEAIRIINKNPKLSSLKQVVQQARKINTIGLTIAQSCFSDVKIRKNETKRVKNRLAEYHSNVREVALASGLFTEKLLDACR